MRKLKIVFFLLAIASCSSLRYTAIPSNYPFSKTLSINLKILDKIVPKFTKLAQLVSFTKGEDTQSLQILLFFGDDIRISVLTLSGLEVLSVKIRGDKIYKLSGIKKMKDDYLFGMIADMLMARSSTGALNKSISGNKKITDKKFKRTIYHGENVLIEVKYDNRNLWKSGIDYKNYEHKYHFKVKNILYEKV